jgi:phytoene/squalene synthetase
VKTSVGEHHPHSIASFSALPFKKRRAVHAVYALCAATLTILQMEIHIRIVQESERLHKLVDERNQLLQNIHQTPMNNSEEEHRYRLMALVDAKERLTRLYEGDETATQGEAIFIAMNEVFKQFSSSTNRFRNHHRRYGR